MSVARSCAAALALTVLVLFAVRLARFEPGRYSADALYQFALAENTASDPSLLAARDYTGRRHPLLVLALMPLAGAFGPRLLPLLVLTYIGHLAASVSLAALVSALGAAPRAAATAGTLFALFGGANNLFADPIHFERTWNLAMALLALVALARGRSAAYVVLYGLTLVNFEDAVLLPLAAVALDASLGDDRVRRMARAHAAAFGLLFIYLALTLAAGTAPSVRADTLSAARLPLLPLHLAHTTFALRSDVVASRPLRLALALPALAAILAGARRFAAAGIGEVRRPAGFLLALAAAFAAPYLARVGGEPWPSRYLYFPAAPFLALVALPLAEAPRLARVGAIGYLGLVGISTTEKAADVRSERDLHPFAPAEVPAAVAAIAASLRGAPPPPIRLDARGCAFLAQLSRNIQSEVPCAAPGLPAPGSAR